MGMYVAAQGLTAGRRMGTLRARGMDTGGLRGEAPSCYAFFFSPVRKSGSPYAGFGYV